MYCCVSVMAHLLACSYVHVRCLRGKGVSFFGMVMGAALCTPPNWVGRQQGLASLAVLSMHTVG